MHASGNNRGESAAMTNAGLCGNNQAQLTFVLTVSIVRVLYLRFSTLVICSCQPRLLGNLKCPPKGNDSEFYDCKCQRANRRPDQRQ